MSPEIHIPCPGCGATVMAVMPRCRYCGELLAASEPPPPLAAPRPIGIRDHALLVAIAAMALPCQSSLASLTPPYRIPHEAIALVPMAAAAAVLGWVLGAVWLPRRTWLLAPAMAFAFHALSAAFVLSWRRLELPLDPALLGVACTIGAAALLATGLGGGAGWLWRRGAWEG